MGAIGHEMGTDHHHWHNMLKATSEISSGHRTSQQRAATITTERSSWIKLYNKNETLPLMETPELCWTMMAARP